MVINKTSYRTHYVNTINIKYYLLSNSFVSPINVYKILTNMKLQIPQINELQFIQNKINTSSLTDFDQLLEVHQGAKEFYESVGLYTNNPNPNCIYINGRCNLN